MKHLTFALPFLLILGLAACDATYSENPGEYESSSSEGFVWASSYSSSSSSSSEARATAGEGCVIGGCSGTVCMNEGDEPIITTCEWREQYACYQTARCEKQVGGECEWTLTEEFTTCLAEHQES